jgi:hypothetical protein
VRTSQGSGKPLMLLVHGYPEGWFCWKHQLAAFRWVEQGRARWQASQTVQGCGSAGGGRSGMLQAGGGRQEAPGWAAVAAAAALGGDSTYMGAVHTCPPLPPTPTYHPCLLQESVRGCCN